MIESHFTMRDVGQASARFPSLHMPPQIPKLRHTREAGFSLQRASARSTSESHAPLQNRKLRQP